jgi:hypothetical protein
VSSLKAQKLRKKKKLELSDPPYLPPEEPRKMRSKDKSNHKNPPEEMHLQDGVAWAVNVAKSVQAGAGKVAESVHEVAVSFSWQLPSCMNSTFIWIHVLDEFV